MYYEGCKKIKDGGKEELFIWMKIMKEDKKENRVVNKKRE